MSLSWGTQKDSNVAISCEALVSNFSDKNLSVPQDLPANTDTVYELEAPRLPSNGPFQLIFLDEVDRAWVL